MSCLGVIVVDHPSKPNHPATSVQIQPKRGPSWPEPGLPCAHMWPQKSPQGLVCTVADSCLSSLFPDSGETLHVTQRSCCYHRTQAPPTNQEPGPIAPGDSGRRDDKRFSVQVGPWVRG